MKISYLKKYFLLIKLFCFFFIFFADFYIKLFKIKIYNLLNLNLSIWILSSKRNKKKKNGRDRDFIFDKRFKIVKALNIMFQKCLHAF